LSPPFEIPLPPQKKNSFKFNSHFGEISPRKTKRKEKKRKNNNNNAAPPLPPRGWWGYLRESIKFCAHDRFRV
jgi:hypothetical protein